MKSIKKLLFVMAALAAVFGFVACSDDDDDDGPGVVATYTDATSVYTVTFYDDDSYEVKAKIGTDTQTAEKGNYDGNPKEASKVKMIPTKVTDKIDGTKIVLKDATDSDKYEVDVDSEGKCVITINGLLYSFTRK